MTLGILSWLSRPNGPLPGGYEEAPAPLPKDHPFVKAMLEAASKGTTAAAASKKRRQEAAASVKRQKVDAY
ncbi:unnamed protein product, partial [Effrenium voratum]